MFFLYGENLRIITCRIRLKAFGLGETNIETCSRRVGVMVINIFFAQTRKYSASVLSDYNVRFDWYAYVVKRRLLSLYDSW